MGTYDGYKARIKELVGEDTEYLNFIELISYLNLHHPGDDLSFTDSEGLSREDFYNLVHVHSYSVGRNIRLSRGRVVHWRHSGQVASLCNAITRGRSHRIHDAWELTDDEVSCKRCLKRMG